MAQEICNNGLDDDGDGHIDCYDFDCVTDAACDSFFYGYPIAPCEVPPPVGPLGLNLVWSSTVNVATRSIALIADMDADGVPEVVARNNGANQVYILDGVTGNLEVTINVPGFMSVSNSLAVADTDNDGFGEVYITPNDQNLYCFEHDGSPKAGFTLNNIGFSETSPGIADFNQDGVPEIYIGNQIYHSQTGALIANGGAAGSKGQNRTYAWHPVAADVLPDGYCADCAGLELVCGNTVYSVNIAGGTLTPLPNNLGALADGFTSVADLTGDGNLDVAVTSQGTVYLWEPITGNQLGATFNLAGTNHGGRPNIADYDNDGLPEIGVGARDIYYVIDYNAGTQAMNTIWTQTTIDGSQMTTGSAFDFEGDGITEVVYRDEVNLYVWDGATGAVKAQTQCGSATRTDFPTVADVNGDGNANIICMCANGAQGDPGKVRVYESSSFPWTATRKVMNQHSYSITNINDDLTVPNSQQNNSAFPEMNNFLSQTLLYDINWEPLLMPVPDMVVSVDTMVFCQNPNEFELTLTVCNQGSHEVDGAIPIALYDGNPATGGTVLDNLTINQVPLDTGSCVTETFNIAWNESPFELWVMVNDDGSIPANAPTTVHVECDYSNNSTSIQVDGINVDPIITGFNSPYCFTDTVIPLNGTPAGGAFSGAGINGNSFNPIDAMPGIHAITYDYSFGVCAFDTTVNVEVRPPLTVNAGSDTSFCSGQSVILGSTGLPGYNYSWSPTTGLDNAAADTPALNLLNSGTTNQSEVYTITVDSAWCNATDDVTITVYPQPLADFDLSDECLNDLNQFTDQSAAYSGTISSYNWDFGDMNSDQTQNPTHVYAASGLYEVQLNIETSFGCEDSLTQQLEIYNLPVANFSTQNICQIDTAAFIDNSSSLSGNITEWQWNFGDGATAVIQGDTNLTHHYTADGTYPLELITTTEFGCSDTILDTIVIHPVPQTEFLFDTACFTHSSHFTDQTSVNTGNAAQWDWDFGGTGSSSQQNPEHIFPDPGTYEVSLTLVTDSGCSGYVKHEIIVYDLPEPDFAAPAVCDEQSMVFSDSSVIANGSIAIHSWEFGDQTNSSDLNPSHLYPADGFYDVQLTLTSDKGCLDSITHEVEIYPLPVVAFSAFPEEGCMPLEVTFYDQTSINAPYSLASWQWSLGDSVVSSEQDTANTYFEAGSYDVSLVVTSGNNCVSSNSIDDMITVYQKPEAGFTTSPERVSILFPKVWFSDESVDAVAWDWQFGDGSVSSSQNPTHSYTDISENSVWQIVSSEHDCLDTAIQTIVVEAEFTLFIPNAFTPDANGHNETFKASGIGITEFTMDIYNRWGEQLFHSADINQGWNGQKNNQGIDLKMGVYIYRITALDYNSHFHEYTGKVNLVR